MSLDRIDTKIGYLPSNIRLVILGFNVGDCSSRKLDEEKTGSSGWTREKLQYAVNQNPRNIQPILSDVRSVFDNCTQSKSSSVEIKMELLIRYHAEHGKWPVPSYVSDEKISLGAFCASVRYATQLTEKQRSRLLAIDPTFFDPKRRKSLSRTEKIDKLIEFYEQHSRWPVTTEMLLDIHVGRFKHDLTKRTKFISEEDRKRLTDVDPSFFQR
jgi:hypothetical protein